MDADSYFTSSVDTSSLEGERLSAGVKHSPNVASAKKAMRDRGMRENDEASIDLIEKIGGRRTAARRGRRASSVSYTSSSTSSSSEVVVKKKSTATARPVLTEASPTRGGPKYRSTPAVSDDDFAEEEELLTYVHKYEDARIPVYVPSEVVDTSVPSTSMASSYAWFPNRAVHRHLPEPEPEPVRLPSSSSSSAVSVPPSDHYEVHSSSSSSLEPEVPPPVIESSASTTEEEIDVEIPEWVQNAAAAEMIDPAVTKPFLRREGVYVPYMCTLLKTNKTQLDMFPVRLGLSHKAPVMRAVDETDGKTRLLIPDHEDPEVGHHALEAFNGYEYPSSESPDLIRARPGLMAHFRNLRLPVWFSTVAEDAVHDETSLYVHKPVTEGRPMPCTSSDLQRTLLIIKRAATTEHQQVRQNFSMATYVRPELMPPPSVMNGKYRSKCLAKLANDHQQREFQFGNVLSDASRRLVTSRAVSRFWKTETKTWVTFTADNGETKRKHLRLWVHPYGPDLVLSDKDGGVMKRVADIANYNGHVHKPGSTHIPAEVAALNPDSHMTYFTCLDHPDEKIWLAFSSVETVKDLRQAAAALTFLKDRRRRVSNENLQERADYGLFDTNPQTRFVE